MPAAAHSNRDPQTSALRVLILEDERFDRHRLARLCSGLARPCTLTNAATLADFTTALESGTFDLVILDYHLPDGTGLDALEQVRMSARNCTAGIIMITGQGHDAIARRAREDGCSDYLTKDELTAPAFQRAVANALQKSELTVELETQTFARAEVEAVLAHFAGQCARDIKPMLSRMMRQLRALRRAGGAPPDADPALIEESCMAMWQFLQQLEQHQGNALFADLAPTPQVPASDRLRPPRKPPSPFTRINH
ncbi:response regulator [Sulfitobacter sp. JB4-11]|uniref:response regulator n=1 Tax=Sulfitobacter rhodophyticola TaxID=3238304 RepID=UPI0035153E80